MAEEEVSMDVVSLKRKADDMTPDEVQQDLPQQQPELESCNSADDTKQQFYDAVQSEEGLVALENGEAATEAPAGQPAIEQQPAEDSTASIKPNEYDKLRWVIVNNDGEPDSMIKLVGLKSLFSKQLPSTSTMR